MTATVEFSNDARRMLDGNHHRPIPHRVTLAGAIGLCRPSGAGIVIEFSSGLSCTVNVL
jgi:hypothetical protein